MEKYIYLYMITQQKGDVCARCYVSDLSLTSSFFSL